MTIPWIQFFYPGFIPGFSTDGNYYWILCYFGGFLGYWLLGYYLNRYPIDLTFNRRLIVIISLSLIYPLGVLYLSSEGIPQEEIAGNLQIGSAAWVALLYTFLYNIKFSSKLQKLLTGIARYSFGIYLTHIYIARELYWGIFDGSHIHIFPRTFIIALLTLITGYILARLLTKAPGGKYITGA